MSRGKVWEVYSFLIEEVARVIELAGTKLVDNLGSELDVGFATLHGRRRGVGLEAVVHPR